MYQPALAHWDDVAMEPYLSIATPSAHFVSYDDERAAVAKVDYIRAHALGGLIIWELAGGYRASQPAGSRDLLLRAIGHAAFGR
jgi:chitinase